MTHVENVQLAETTHPLAITWGMHLVFHWLGGEPMSSEEELRFANYHRRNPETSIIALDINADAHLPLLELNLDVVTLPSDIGEVVDESLVTEAGARGMKKEAALSKAIIASLGGLVSAGVPLESLELTEAHLVEDKQLQSDRSALQADLPVTTHRSPQSAAIGLFVDSDRYREDELAHSVFRDEHEIYTDLMDLAA